MSGERGRGLAGWSRRPASGPVPKHNRLIYLFIIYTYVCRCAVHGKVSWDTFTLLADGVGGGGDFY
jgi:hypothetical protein